MPNGLSRFYGEGHYHFITFNCYRRLPALNNDTARILFEEQLERVRKEHDFYLFGYVLMPEHVHLHSEDDLQTLSSPQPPQKSPNPAQTLASLRLQIMSYLLP